MSIYKTYYPYITDALRVYRVLPRYLRRGAWYIFFLQTSTAILESSTIIAISLFLTSISSSATLMQSKAFQMIAVFLPEQWLTWLQSDKLIITFMCSILVGFIILKNLVTGFTISRTTLFSEKLGLFISEETLHRYFCKSYFWHISSKSSWVLQRLNSRSQLTGMATAMLQFLGYMLCCIFMLASLFMYEPGLTLILALVFAIVSAATYIGVRHRIDRSGQELAEITTRENWYTSMATRGIREIIIYRKQKVFLENIMRAIQEEVPYKAFLSFAGMLPGWFLEVSGFVTIFGVMVVMSLLDRPMSEIISAVSMLFLSAWRVLPAVSRSMGLTVTVRGLRPMAMNCLELLEEFAAAESDDTIEPDENFHFDDTIELRHVDFSYPDTEIKCLHAISLTLIKGECIGLVGPSGAGKSTLAMILAGLLEPASGEMCIDGIPLSTEGREAYRHRVGLVPQNPLLLPGSIADNVALSCWGEVYNRDKVAEVCRLAAMDFLADDPRGMDFPIGDGGQGLSGGQAQRVSIARALFGNPDVLVFDEATSSLDLASESIIEQTVASIKGKVTTIIIAHRLTSVANCDRIIWLANGSIVEMGETAKILPHYIENLQNAGVDQAPENSYV